MSEFGSWKKIGFEISLGAANFGLAAAPWRARSRSEAYLGGAASAGGAWGRNSFESALFLRHETQQV